MNTTTKSEIIPMDIERNEFIKFNDKNKICQWYSYTTNWPEKDALHLIWFEYGICMTIEHFNTDESHKEPKDRCLNRSMYNKYIVNVVARQKEGPHKQVVPFKESLCDTLEQALSVADKYNGLHYEAARDAQIEHMNVFKTTDLT